MIGLRQQHDQRGYRVVGSVHNADRAGVDQGAVIVEHRPRRLADALDVDRVGGGDDCLDRGAVTAAWLGGSRVRQLDHEPVLAGLDPARQFGASSR